MVSLWHESMSLHVGLMFSGFPLFMLENLGCIWFNWIEANDRHVFAKKLLYSYNGQVLME